MDKNYLLDIMVSVRERNMDVNEAVEMVCALENAETGDRQLTIPAVVGRSEQLLEEQSNWLMANTSLEVEKIVDFKEHFK